MQDKIDHLRQQAVSPQGLFIDGRWQEAAEGRTMAVVSPIDGRHLTTLAAASAAAPSPAPATASKRASGRKPRPPSARRCC